MLSLCFACTTEEPFDPPNIPQQQQTGRVPASNPKNNALPRSKVVLLKVDFLTHVFEGAKELTFATNPNFSIAFEYVPPVDFGGVTLNYFEVNQPIFQGTITWMGLGMMQYPMNMDPVSAFPTVPNPLPLPGDNVFSPVMYHEYAYYPDPIPYAAIWNAIANRQIVAQYRASNPNSPIHIFLYTPSVGVGNPADWDYFIILKN